MSSPPVFSGIRVTGSLVLCVCFVYRCLSICNFPFGHYTDYDYPFDIFKLFIKVPPSMICFKRKNLTQVKSVWDLHGLYGLFLILYWFYLKKTQLFSCKGFPLFYVTTVKLCQALVYLLCLQPFSTLLGLLGHSTPCLCI
jgi:hypothetical protein